MMSDEKRDHKPYALPVKFVPCQTLRDQQVRDLNREVKKKMSEIGLKVVGEQLTVYSILFFHLVLTLQYDIQSYTLVIL